MAQRQATSYYISGVALNNDPISSFTGVDSNSSSDSSSVTYNIVLSDDADKHEIHNGMITKGTNESNSSKSPSVATKSTGFSVAEVKTNVSSNKEGKNLGPLSESKVVSLQTSAKMSSKPQNGGPSKQESTPVSSNSSYRGRLTGSDNAMTSTNSSAVEGVKSVSSVHQVSSPAVITLPDSSSRPIKLVFHTKDMNNVDVTSKVYQLTTMHNDVGKTLNDNGELSPFLFWTIAPTVSILQRIKPILSSLLSNAYVHLTTAYFSNFPGTKLQCYRRGILDELFTHLTRHSNMYVSISDQTNRYSKGL